MDEKKKKRSYNPNLERKITPKKDMLYYQFCENIEAFRKIKGLGVDDFAKIMGIGEGGYSGNVKYKSKQHNRTMKNTSLGMHHLLRLCNHFNVRIGDIVYLHETSPHIPAPNFKK